MAETITADRSAGQWIPASAGMTDANNDRRCARLTLVSDGPAELNAAQQDVLARLRRPAGEHPTFDAGLGGRLREELESALADVAEGIDPSRPLFVNKHTLTGVFGCEASFLHDERQGFAWDPPKARGSVAHKAIELGINWRSSPSPPSPPDLVDSALESLTAAEKSLGIWLHQCPAAERADLRSLAISRVAAFFESWPPLKSQWYPVTESGSRIELCDGRIQLAGKCDLTLGRSDGRRAGKVIVDLKSGRRYPHLHRDDLRFYALLETVKLGTPPRTLATYYLESAHIDVEDVTEALLEVARTRTIDGARRYAQLHGHLGPPPDPIKRPGPPCNWCELLDNCTEGQQHLAQHRDT